MTPQADGCAASPSPEVLDLVRELPAGTVRVLLDALWRANDGPRCAEAQADGTPCTAAQTDCARCRRFLEVVERLRAAVGA